MLTGPSRKRAGGEEGSGEDGGAVEWEAEEGLVGGVDEWGGDVVDGELAESDGAGEKKVLGCGVRDSRCEGDGGDSGARDEGGEEEAVGGGSELGEEAGGGAEESRG